MGTSAAPRAPVLLRPVLAAADRMRTSLRLGALVLFLMVPGMVATVGYTSEVNNKIDFSALELEGTEVMRPALIALADTAAGRPADLAPVQEAVAGHPELKLSFTPPDDRLALAQALVTLITETANSSNLIVDPDLDSFYLMDALIVQLPKALLAATEAGLAEAGTGSDAVAAQAVRAGTLSGAAESLRTDISTADQSTGLDGLAERLAPLARAADAIAALATTLTGSLAAPGPADPAAAAGAVRAAVDPLADALEDLLTGRIDGFTSGRLLVLIVAVGGFVLGAWFAAGVFWRTRHDVALAVTGVTAIADGDFGGRPVPAGRDELGDIGRALETARTRLRQQETALREAQSVREEQLRVSFLHQRQAELRLRDRAQSIIDESTSVIAEELREVTAQVERRTAGLGHHRQRDLRDRRGHLGGGRSRTPRRGGDRLAGAEPAPGGRDRGAGAGHRRPDPAARPERHHRGGPGRRARPRLHRGGRRGEGTRHHHLPVHRADRGDHQRAGARHRGDVRHDLRHGGRDRQRRRRGDVAAGHRHRTGRGGRAAGRPDGPHHRAGSSRCPAWPRNWNGGNPTGSPRPARPSCGWPARPNRSPAR